MYRRCLVLASTSCLRCIPIYSTVYHWLVKPTSTTLLIVGKTTSTYSIMMTVIVRINAERFAYFSTTKCAM
ncbi:hypothetical protein C8R41DRAFT_828154 [Lentinula lateritia]|uniref:Secreted protein n=1 Tax=Lentinula lateritia TaxID=40482 RepID=A0ABQ8VIL2_9AGAR|nr:hypothetical protein C8R41DRAFT_828154 [Lentinula lateritia]